MSKSVVLIIEDNRKLARVLKLELELENYTIETAHDGLRGYELAVSKSWDLILLDIMLPKLDGLEVLRRFREQNTQTPVILLTVRDSIPDRVRGLDQGADDYVTKPFKVEELTARIRSCIRRHEGQHFVHKVWKIADLSIDEDKRQVKHGGNVLELTKREFDLLVCLVKHKNQVLNREQILKEVWGFDFMGDTNIVDVYIRYLRVKIDQGMSNALIHTIRGVGYILKDSDS